MVKVVSTANLDRRVFDSCVGQDSADGIIWSNEEHNPVAFEQYLQNLLKQKVTPPKPLSFGKKIS